MMQKNIPEQTGNKLYMLLFLLLAVRVIAIAQQTEIVRHFTTDSGVEFGLWGGNNEKKPAPILFLLASSIDTTLGMEYYRQCGNRLSREYGWLCVSLDLPYHGKLEKDTANAGLKGWAKAIKRKEDFVRYNNQRMRDILNYLIEKGTADEKNIFACGTSRGGYLALQFAATEPRLRSVVAIGPVTEIMAVREFSDIAKGDLLPIFNLDNQLDSLAKRDVWLVIGDRDERVGTHLVVALAEKIRHAQRSINSSARMELNIMWEPKGHTTPKGAVDRGVAWLSDSWQKK